MDNLPTILLIKITTNYLEYNIFYLSTNNLYYILPGFNTKYISTPS